MNIDEISDKFDVLLNSYGNISQFGNDTSHTNIALDEYEKSLFLTEAQDELYVQLYTGRIETLEGFESTEELRSYLFPLLEEKSLTSNNESITKEGKFYITSFSLPDDIQFITLEHVAYDTHSCVPRNNVEVVPIKQDEWHKLKRNPFRGPKDSQVLRLDVGGNNKGNRFCRLVSTYPIKTYTIKYLRKLNPIILVNLSGLYVKGKVNKSSTIDLPESLHDRLLRIAVQKALASKSIGNTNNKE